MAACTPSFYIAFLALAVLLLAAGAGWYIRMLRRRARRCRIRTRARLDAQARRTRASIDTMQQSMQGLILKVHGVALRMPADEPLRAILDDVLTQAESMVWGEEWTAAAPTDE